jgi:hypothetical protein
VTSGSYATQSGAFLPSADGWKQFTVSSVAAATKESPFITPGDIRKIERGHANQPLYTTATPGSTVVLNSYTPSFTNISSGGTTLATMDGDWWGFGSVALPAAGTYRIRIRPANQHQSVRGFTVEYSTTDATCFDFDGSYIWESMHEQLGHSGGNAYVGTQSTPAADGTAGVFIVGTGATGKWAMHDGDFTRWNTLTKDWEFRSPRNGSVLIGTGARSTTDFVWHDGVQWKSSSDAPVSIVVSVSAATTVYLSIGAYTAEWDSSPDPKVIIDWAAI